MSTTVSVSRSHEGRPLGVGIAGPQVILVSGIGCSPKNSVSDHAEAHVVTFGVLAGGAADGGLAGAFGDGEAVARAGEGGEEVFGHASLVARVWPLFLSRQTEKQDRKSTRLNSSQ